LTLSGEGGRGFYKRFIPQPCPLDDARGARDEALTRVLDNEPESFKGAVWALAFGPLPWAEFTGEDFRVWCEKEVGKPHHHNVWGGMVNGLVRSGIFINTGKREQMRTRPSHARNTPIYRQAK